MAESGGKAAGRQRQGAITEGDGERELKERDLENKHDVRDVALKLSTVLGVFTGILAAIAWYCGWHSVVIGAIVALSARAHFMHRFDARLRELEDYSVCSED